MIKVGCYLELMQKNKRVSLKDWANQILEDMEPFFETLYIKQSDKTHWKEMASNPEETFSAKFIQTIFDSNLDLNEFGIYIAGKNSREFCRIDNKENSIWDLLDNECTDSKKRQESLESVNPESFKEYIDKYFKS